MGRVRPTYIKRVAIELVRNHPDRFTDDFDHNKAVVDELTDVDSISMRNRITGYVTCYRKQEHN
jgi:small subunit ribosomal protein S17e